MLAVERKCPRVRGADAQLGDLNTMPAHKIHCVVLKFAADARASHLRDQVKEVHVPASWLLEDLHLHLSNDLAAMPDVDVPVRELSSTQPKLLDVVHALGSGFTEKAILAEATYIRVAPERDTRRRMRVEIDRLEYESLELHKLVCPTVCVTCVWAGVESVWEQNKLEARKMLENGAESHKSGARCVSPQMRHCALIMNKAKAEQVQYYMRRSQD